MFCEVRRAFLAASRVFALFWHLGDRFARSLAAEFGC